MRNFFSLTLIAAAAIVLSSDCEAFQGRQGGPGGGQRGQRSPQDMMASFPIIKALDADGNGEISTAEMQAAASALASLDANSDGILDATEIMPQRGRGGPGGGRGEGGPGGGRGEGGPGGGRGRGGGEGGGGGGRGGDSEGFVTRLMENDADGDGKVSLAEAPERMQNFFGRLDGDSDGFLTREEVTEASKRFGGGGGGGPRGGGGGGEGQRPRRPGSE